MKLQKYNFSIGGMGDIVGQKSQGIGAVVAFFDIIDFQKVLGCLNQDLSTPDL